MNLPEHLTLPVSEDTPCGDDLEYDNRFQELERAAEGTPERIMGDAVIPAEEPDWQKVRELALALLAETRDLRIAVRLTQALAHTEGFPGVAEGLSLIRQYLERYWECLHPQLDPEEDNDPTFRLNTLENLDDPGFFLSALRAIPLVEVKGIGRFSLNDIEAATEGEDENLSPELITAAFHKADPETLAATRRHIEQAAGHLGAIRTLLAEKVDPEQVPPFKRAAALFQQLLETFGRYGPATTPLQEEGDIPAPEAGPVTAAAPAQIRGFRNREEIAKVLDLMCEYFERHEPTSPVPLLLQRAKRLMTMNFMELVEELANDGSHQAANILGVVRED